MKIQDLIVQLYAVKQQLEYECSDFNRSFALDGHLLGSIGEVIVAEAYGLGLYKSATPVYDAYTLKSPRHEVQIKTTQGNRIALNWDGSQKCIPEYIIAIKIFPNGSWEEIYNGPGEVVCGYVGKQQKNGQRSISVQKLRCLMRRDGAEKQKLPRTGS